MKLPLQPSNFRSAFSNADHADLNADHEILRTVFFCQLDIHVFLSNFYTDLKILLCQSKQQIHTSHSKFLEF